MPETVSIKVDVSEIEFLAPLLLSLDLAIKYIRADLEKMKSSGITDYGRYTAFSALIYDYDNFKDLPGNKDKNNYARSARVKDGK